MEGVGWGEGRGGSISQNAERNISDIRKFYSDVFLAFKNKRKKKQKTSALFAGEKSANRRLSETRGPAGGPLPKAELEGPERDGGIRVFGISDAGDFE